MQSRKSSVVSTTSLKHRKFSTTRLQRQAELSLLNEETHHPALSITTKHSSTAESFENFSFPTRSATLTSLRRRETGEASPLDAHPGSRLRGFSRASFSSSPESVRGSFAKPFDEPYSSQGTGFGRRFPVTKRTLTGPIDIEHASEKIQQQGLDTQVPHVSLRREDTSARGGRGVKPGDLHERKALYVFDFDTNNTALSLRGKPLAFEKVSELRKHLSEAESATTLRIIYVCNQHEAIKYLDETFKIDESTGADPERGFRYWMQNDKESRGASNKAIRWRPTFDSGRNRICTAFGLDFGSIILTKKGPNAHVHSNQTGSESSRDSTSHLYRQRLSVFMQRPSNQPEPAENIATFSTAPYKLPEQTSGNLMIISEYSSGAVGEVVNTQDLLTLNLGSSVFPGVNNDEAAISAAQSIIVHIFSQVCQIWRDQITLIHDEHADLEDHVYAQPADGSRAGNVWAMSQHLHDMLKLMNRHAKLIQAVQEDFQLFIKSEIIREWLDDTIEEFVQLSNDLSTDYLEPVEHMIDLMYKSVTIRDSKQSLELSASLWRLSWITFIFLPLTFLTGIFGMNVASLQNYPSIKWYFVAAIPLMGLVFASWFGFRRLLPYAGTSEKIGYSDFELISLQRVGPGLRNQGTFVS